MFLQILEEVRQTYQFVAAAYVVMPEHFHLLVTEPERNDLSRAMQVLKQRTAHRLLEELRGSSGLDEDHFWQRRFYDFSVWSAAKHSAKVHYIHLNPVRRGLVAEPERWLWSSFRAGGPPFGSPDFTTTVGAPPLRSLQGWEPRT